MPDPCRVFEVCARNGVGTARPPRRLSSRSGASPSPSASPLSVANSSPFSAEQPFAGHDVDSTQVAASDSNQVQDGTLSPKLPLQQQQQDGALSSRDAAGQALLSSCLLHWYVSLCIAAKVRKLAASDTCWTRLLLLPCQVARQSCQDDAKLHLVCCAAALLPALAVFDLPGFVLLLSRRLAAGGAEPSSPTHVMSFLALLRLAHSQQARRRVTPQYCLGRTCLSDQHQIKTHQCSGNALLWPPMRAVQLPSCRGPLLVPSRRFDMLQCYPMKMASWLTDLYVYLLDAQHARQQCILEFVTCPMCTGPTGAGGSPARCSGRAAAGAGGAAAEAGVPPCAHLFMSVFLFMTCCICCFTRSNNPTHQPASEVASMCSPCRHASMCSC